MEELPLRWSLLPSMRLYVMADKFAVSGLKLLARGRLYRIAEVCWRSSDEFPTLVDELYSHDTCQTSPS